MPLHAQSSLNSRYPLHVQIEMKNPNLQGTLLKVQKRCGIAFPHQNEVLERRSHAFPPHYTPEGSPNTTSGVSKLFCQRAT